MSVDIRHSQWPCELIQQTKRNDPDCQCAVRGGAYDCQAQCSDAKRQIGRVPLAMWELDNGTLLARGPKAAFIADGVSKAFWPI